jgi:hypothetical protein
MPRAVLPLAAKGALGTIKPDSVRRIVLFYSLTLVKAIGVPLQHVFRCAE